MQANVHAEAAANDRATGARDAGHAVEVIAGAAKTVGRTLIAQVRTHPALAVGASVALGFILGGGLSTRVGRLAVLALLEYTVARAKPSRWERAEYVEG
jgi:hypothetical protein